MKIVTISSKNQITLPKKDLDDLNIKPSSKLIVERKGKKLVLELMEKSITEQTAGALRPYTDPKLLGIPFKKVREETQKIVARELAEKI